MTICGLQKTTLLDFPGHVACTIFLGGCNFRCPFCHNGQIVTPRPDTPENENISETELFRFLQKRKPVLEGVCISGGEPTLSHDLRTFITTIRSFGYRIKLDTNGYEPDILQDLLSRNLLDYVAMDIKAAPHRYASACGIPDLDFDRIRQSVHLLRSGRIPYEFRTTTARELQSMEDFSVIGAWLSDSPAYYLQSYQDCETLSGLHFTPYTKEELEQAAGILQQYIPNTRLRGI